MLHEPVAVHVGDHLGRPSPLRVDDGTRHAAVEHHPDGHRLGGHELPRRDAGHRERVVEEGHDIAGDRGLPARVQDLDGDGQPEIVVVWTSYFGNSYASSLSVLSVGRVEGNKRLWREASTVEIVGSDPELDIRDASLSVDSMTLGPNDARCCPTKKVHRERSYRGGKLVAR